MNAVDLNTIETEWQDLVATIKSAMRFCLRNVRDHDSNTGVVVCDSRYVTIERKPREIIPTVVEIGGEWDAACGETAEATVTLHLDHVMRHYKSDDQKLVWAVRYFIAWVD